MWQNVSQLLVARLLMKQYTLRCCGNQVLTVRTTTKCCMKMEQKQITSAYADAVKAIKEAILESRYRAARLVNKELLALYYAIGGYISVQSRAARWGSNAIGTISESLQRELPGLRGFSETSIKRMRIFYEAWSSMFENRPSPADDLQNSIIPVGDEGHIVVRPLTTDELPPETFLSLKN